MTERKARQARLRQLAERVDAHPSPRVREYVKRVIDAEHNRRCDR